MRRDQDEAREQLEYLFERFGGDSEALFDSPPGPETVRILLRLGECLLCTGDNELADTLIRCAAAHSKAVHYAELYDGELDGDE